MSQPEIDTTENHPVEAEPGPPARPGESCLAQDVSFHRSELKHRFLLAADFLP